MITSQPVRKWHAKVRDPFHSFVLDFDFDEHQLGTWETAVDFVMRKVAIRRFGSSRGVLSEYTLRSWRPPDGSAEFKGRWERGPISFEYSFVLSIR